MKIFTEAINVVSNTKHKKKPAKQLCDKYTRVAVALTFGTNVYFYVIFF